MNIIYVNDEAFDKKVSRMSVAELERAVQQLQIHLANYAKTVENYSAEHLEKYSKPYIARYEGRLAGVRALLNSRR